LFLPLATLLCSVSHFQSVSSSSGRHQVASMVTPD
jgi:hypothetical protein